jgi:hypothetical protein
MKADKNFRLSKTSKRMLALMQFKNEHDRGAFKRLMIDAELAKAQARIAKLKDKEKQD